MPKDFTPILAIDFDGVIHSYTSGWKGARNIPDPPVNGAIEWLKQLVYDQRDPFAPRYFYFDVRIFSSRSRHVGGRSAMKRWLLENGMTAGEIEAIGFPLLKPPAHVLIDDRAWTFTGTFPTPTELRRFRPWNKAKGRMEGIADVTQDFLGASYFQHFDEMRDSPAYCSGTPYPPRDRAQRRLDRTIEKAKEFLENQDDASTPKK